MNRQWIYLTGIAVAILYPLLTWGSDPIWWTTRGVRISGATTNDYAVVNLGQLRHIAQGAYNEMDAVFPGGAGTNLDALIASQVFTGGLNYAAVNIGQVKSMAKPFYDRLTALGYTNTYPWTTAVTDDVDYALANIGQAKLLFSFEISTPDFDNDGLPNDWEIRHGLNPNDATDDNGADGDPDGDGWVNLEEYQSGTDPGSQDHPAVGLIVFTPLE